MTEERAECGLLELIAERPLKDAEAAIAALEPYKTDKNLWQQVQTAVQQRDDAKLMMKTNPGLLDPPTL